MHIWARSSSPDRGWVAQALPTPPPDVLAVVRSAVDASGSLTGHTPPRYLQRPGESSSAARPTEASSSLPVMKQTLGDLMRMSRICRMIFATCLGSFILVIFYFQSMFQPGRMLLLPLVHPGASPSCSHCWFHCRLLALWHID